MGIKSETIDGFCFAFSRYLSFQFSFSFARWHWLFSYQQYYTLKGLLRLSAPLIRHSWRQNDKSLHLSALMTLWKGENSNGVCGIKYSLSFHFRPIKFVFLSINLCHSLCFCVNYSNLNSETIILHLYIGDFLSNIYGFIVLFVRYQQQKHRLFDRKYSVCIVHQQRRITVNVCR